MLLIGSDPLPQSLLSYVAFRVALRTTWDGLEAAIAAGEADGSDGFLAEVPFLQEVPLRVQIDVLASTWRKHLSTGKSLGTLLDESVIYAACERTAVLVEQNPLQVTRALRSGPFDITIPIGADFASELRQLYLRLPSDGDFLLIGQLLDLPPKECRHWKQQFGIDGSRLEVLFETLGRWHVSPELVKSLHGLITPHEASRLARWLNLPCPSAP